MVSTTGRAAVTTLFILTAILAGCSKGGDSAEPADTGSEDAHLISMTFTFQGEGDGEIVGVHENQVTTIPAAGEMYTGVYDVELDGEPTAVETELRLVGEGVDWGRAFAAPLTIDSLEPHEWSDGMLIEGSFTNDTDDTLELLEVICILRNGDTIVGSGFSVIEPVDPGGSEPWDVLTQVAASSADCLTAQQV